MSMIGRILGNFECTTLLGKGGMGEVYRARDRKLGRDVAVKVLPEEFAKDAERVARFQREAKLLASLNHPNIASIYGLEESDETHFLVLELIEGDTLADRLKQGAIPVEEALKLALQIAEALEAAHEKGVIHRDLKPANIKVTPDGKVKVLDFGLAKAFAGDPEDMNLSNSPTLSVAATRQGVILGTAAYMSPEQAKGKAVDRRTDVWAFGCVLYEMLTGKPAFQGEDITEILAAVVKLDANMKLLPADIHPRVRELLTRCLQKDAKRRYSGVSDVQYDIEQVLADPGGLFAQPAAATKPRKKLRLGIPWIAAVAALCLLVAGVAVWYLKPPEPRRVMRFYHELPADQIFVNPADSVVGISADGTKIAYSANGQIYLRNLNELAASPIKGTDEGSVVPIFSPDGLWVGYYAVPDRQWKKISVSGGASVTLCDADLSFGATWGPDNTILFAESAGIKRVSANGGTAELLIERKEGEWFHGPQALPGGEWVLFTLGSEDFAGWDKAQIAAQSLETGERRILVSGAGDARYVPTGHLVYAFGDVLYARAFDTDSMEVKGGAVPVVEGVQRAAVTGSANYGFSDTGELAYVVGSGKAVAGRNLVWVGRNGEEEPLGTELKIYSGCRISPDGTRVALSIYDSTENNDDIWIWDLARETLTRLTFDKATDMYPLWAPDSKRIVFYSEREGNPGGVYWKQADGTGKAERLASMEDRELIPWSWSGDGNTLLLQESMGDLLKLDIGALSLEGNRERMPLLQEEYIEVQPQISPDGQWMAYASNESGEVEVYVRPFPDINAGKWQVSKGNGENPLWSPDGTELFYQNEGSVMAVAVETAPTFKPGKPELLFQGEYIDPGLRNLNTWDIHPDGKRFLMMKGSIVSTSSEEASQPRINIIANWFEELKELVPTK